MSSEDVEHPTILSRSSSSALATSSRSYGDLLAAAETRASLSGKPKAAVRPMTPQVAKLRINATNDLLPPTVYVRERDGQVLGRGMVLKADHFPAGDRSKNLDMHISGGPNFRRVIPFPIYAVGQPSIYGYLFLHFLVFFHFCS